MKTAETLKNLFQLFFDFIQCAIYEPFNNCFAVIKRYMYEKQKRKMLIAEVEKEFSKLDPSLSAEEIAELVRIMQKYSMEEIIELLNGIDRS